MEMTLHKLKRIMRDNGVRNLYLKHLSPNDNSKNQPYLGGDYSSLNIIPTGEIVVAQSSSRKKTGGKNKQIFRAPLDFSWIDPDGCLLPAPHAKLILYPQYPEVRFSGFLKGSKVSLGRWMDPYKQGRAPGRILLLGVTDEGKVIGFLAIPDTPLAHELSAHEGVVSRGVFFEIPVEDADDLQVDPRVRLLKELKEIHLARWISGKRLDRDGKVVGCNNPNCGGYTLEAELGITPNGFSEPDYLGWELKQFGVGSFENFNSKVVTLMTPEPTGGIYRDDGVRTFLYRFGYVDQRGRPDRINFGGVHRCGHRHDRTNLLFRLDGFDESTGSITDPGGGMVLETVSGEVAVKWHFAGLIEHWRRKHAQAAYIPSLSRKTSLREYWYGYIIKLGEGTDFTHFLKAVASGEVYYDPGIKMEKASSAKPQIKRRSQFRIKTGNLGKLYNKFSHVDLLKS